jgi:hypothetical protein
MSGTNLKVILRIKKYSYQKLLLAGALPQSFYCVTNGIFTFSQNKNLLHLLLYCLHSASGFSDYLIFLHFISRPAWC